MHKHPPPISGGYRRRLKKKESTKGFTLVELIVVIVILAILAAILIPGLLKWIDQAKDKKYELEAREIALAAEAAWAKVYAEGIELEGVMEYDDGRINYNFMKLDSFKQKIEKLTGADVKAVFLYSAGYSNTDDYGMDRSWEGNNNVSGFEIWFVSSDRVNIKAYYLSGPEIVNDNGHIIHTPTDGWEITKDPEYWDNYTK